MLKAEDVHPRDDRVDVAVTDRRHCRAIGAGRRRTTLSAAGGAGMGVATLCLRHLLDFTSLIMITHSIMIIIRCIKLVLILRTIKCLWDSYQRSFRDVERRNMNISYIIHMNRNEHDRHVLIIMMFLHAPIFLFEVGLVVMVLICFGGYLIFTFPQNDQWSCHMIGTGMMFIGAFTIVIYKTNIILFIVYFMIGFMSFYASYLKDHVTISMKHILGIVHVVTQVMLSGLGGIVWLY